MQINQYYTMALRYKILYLNGSIDSNYFARFSDISGQRYSWEIICQFLFEYANFWQNVINLLETYYLHWTLHP